jgi:uncharacterized protein (TIGR03435 family)
MAIAVPATIGVMQASQLRAQSALSGPAFEVASVKLNKSNERTRVSAVPAAGRLVISGMTVEEVIEGAYAIQQFALVTRDSPVLKERIDIEAKTEQPVASVAQMQQMLQPLLAERFKLAVHREMREMNALLVMLANKDGRLGPKMKKTDTPCDALGTTVIRFVVTAPAPSGERPACGFMPSGAGRIVGTGLDMATLVGSLAPSQRMPIVDQTGLQGRYDIDVTYTPEPFSAAALAQRGGGAPPPGVDPNGPSLFTALEDQLGLRLQPKKMPVPVVVIDHIEPLREN